MFITKQTTYIASVLFFVHRYTTFSKIMSLVNVKLHFFGLTQLRFILNSNLNRLYMCTTCFGLYLGYRQACLCKNLKRKT